MTVKEMGAAICIAGPFHFRSELRHTKCPTRQTARRHSYVDAVKRFMGAAQRAG
jgi:hypothetical protein